MSDQPLSSRVSVGGVARSGDVPHETASFGATSEEADRRGEAIEPTGGFSSRRVGNGSPVSASSEQAGIQITGRFGGELDDVELDPPTSSIKPRERGGVAMLGESTQEKAKRKKQANEQEWQPPQQRTHEEPQPPHGTRSQVDPEPTADGSSLTSPTTTTRPGAYWMQPGRPSQRATSIDSAVNMTDSGDAEAATTGDGDGTLLVEANLVDEGDDARPREALSPLVEATPIRRRRQIAVSGIAVILVIAIIVGVVTGLLSRSSVPPPVPPPTIPPTTQPGYLLLQILPPYTQASIEDPSSPQKRAFDWVRYNDTVHWRDEPDDTDQRLIRMGQRFALATLYYATSGETSWQQRRSWLNTTGSECEWWGCCCGPVCKLFDGDRSDSDSFGNETGSTELTGLFLSENRLDGPLPPEIGLLTTLQRLDLNGNRINGHIPTQLSDVAGLITLRLSSNFLSGTIPTQLGLLTVLSDLALDGGGNKDSQQALSGTIPSEFERLTRLTRLNFGKNLLSSTLPTQLAKLTRLAMLRLDQNELTGTIPTEWGSLSALTSMEMWTNRLKGTLPTELGLLTEMKYLSLSDNDLSGSFPSEMSNLRALGFFDFNYNRLTSTIPSYIGSFSKLSDLWLAKNLFTGSLPSELSLLRNLKFLTLRFNQFNSTIPTELGEMTQLEHLLLKNNTLTGALPSELGNLIALSMLDVSYNLLASTVPASLGKLTDLKELQFEGNFLSGTLPSDLGRLTSLDPEKAIRLGMNRLSGTVPAEICWLLRNHSIQMFIDCLDAFCDCNCSCTESSVDDTYYYY